VYSKAPSIDLPNFVDFDDGVTDKKQQTICLRIPRDDKEQEEERQRTKWTVGLHGTTSKERHNDDGDPRCRGHRNAVLHRTRRSACRPRRRVGVSDHIGRARRTSAMHVNLFRRRYVAARARIANVCLIHRRLAGLTFTTGARARSLSAD